MNSRTPRWRICAGILQRAIWGGSALTHLLSLFLAFFNLIPIFPLDGSHIVQAILPYEKARNYASFMSRYGMILLLILIVTGMLGRVVVIPALLLYYLLSGSFFPGFF